MFDARWYGIGFNYGSIYLTGDTKRYTIDWGDGTIDSVRTDSDDDGDPFSSGDAGHGYQSDGQYIVSVKQVGVGLPPERLRAFMYANATADVTVSGGQSRDILTGGYGSDTLKGKGDHDTIAGNDGNDRLYGGDGDDFLLGGQQDDVVYGDAGGDLIGGNEGDDRLFGGGDGDFIYGDDGADNLGGEDGDDYLNGGAGVDRLTGGAGSDVFVFAAPFVDGSQVTSDRDRDLIVDFQQGTDAIDVRQWFGGDFGFVGTASFSAGGTGELRYTQQGSDTLVLGDIDGNGTVDFGFRIAGQVALQASDVGAFGM